MLVSSPYRYSNNANELIKQPLPESFQVLIGILTMLSVLGGAAYAGVVSSPYRYSNNRTASNRF